MAYISYNKLWESEFDGIVSKRDKLQDSNISQLKHNKQSVEDILIQRAVKTTIQILYDKGLFDNFQNADKVLEDFLFTARRREDLSNQVNDNIQ